MPTVTRQIQVRQGTAAQWAAANTVLLLGEIGLETDTLRTKIGDGSTAWNSLRYGLSRMPYSRATVASGTTLTGVGVESPTVLGSLLTVATTGPGHTVAADGITVPPGDYMVRTLFAWNVASSAYRGCGVYDGTEYQLTGAAGGMMRMSGAFLVNLSASTKLQPAYVCDSTISTARALSSTVVSSFSVMQLA